MQIKLSKNILIILLFLTFFFQLYLISHRTGFDIKLLKNSYKKDIGKKESLMIDRQFNVSLEILNIIEKYKIKNYNLSQELKKHVSYTHTISLSYPAKLNENSNNYFTKISEEKKNCQIVTTLELIKYYKC